MAQITHLDVKYKAFAREEFGTSKMREAHADALIEFNLIISGRQHSIGKFKLSEMRMMLGSEHAHYIAIVKNLADAYKGYDDVDDPANTLEGTEELTYTGSNGLEVTKFKNWALKYRGVSHMHVLLDTLI